MADVESIELGQQPIQVCKGNIRMLAVVEKREAYVSELSN